MVGAFGALIAAAQAALLERGAWAALLAPDAGGAGGAGQAEGRHALVQSVGVAFGAFTAALFAFSSLVPVVLVWGGATALNLSLLTSDMWAAAARVLLFGGFGGAGGWFAASLALVAAGLVLYASAGSAKADDGRGAAGDGGASALHASARGFEAVPVADEDDHFSSEQQEQQRLRQQQEQQQGQGQQLRREGSGADLLVQWQQAPPPRPAPAGTV
jgi:hypothetical protein